MSHFLSSFAQIHPPILPEARPATRWWWMGSAVDSSGLLSNIRTYARAGLGALEITPIYGVQGNDKNEIPYLSPRWMQMLAYTQKVGHSNGVEIDMNNGTGWPFGGPSVTLDDAATKAIFQEYRLSGKGLRTLDITLSDAVQRPFVRLGKVMAYRLTPDGVTDPARRTTSDVYNLTPMISGNTLTWKAPKGEWRVIVLYIGKTLQKVKRAAPGGEGWVMNHFDSTAVSHYLSRFDEAFQSSPASYPHTFFNDSYEVYEADWTPTLLDDFFRLRGYRLEEYFPEFLSLDRSDASRRIISDYRETLSDLLIHNFTTRWTAWAHRHGSITRNQAHGSPANLLDTYGVVDIPEIEGFGLSQFHIKGLRQDSLTRKNYSDLSMLKYASSAAHVLGKPFVSSETFTWLTEHFRTSLSQCKPDMDLMFVGGVNHMFFHGTAYSPPDAPWPGWKFYASIDMSPTNSIWRDSPAFFDYITRCQSWLQWGTPDNDFLIYLPVYDMWYSQEGRLLQFDIHSMEQRAPAFIRTIHRINESGYDVDYISDRMILSTTCNNGRLVTSGGTPYKALLVPGANRMPVDVLRHLLALAHEGATIVFLNQYPADVPGYDHYAERRKELLRLEENLPSAPGTRQYSAATYGSGRIILGYESSVTLGACGTLPEEMKTRYGLQLLRRKNPQGYHYFISSLQERDVDDWVTLAVPAREALLTDPLTGRQGEAQLRQTAQGTQVRLQLKSGESTLLQTFTDTLLANLPRWSYLEEEAPCPLVGKWTLRFLRSSPDSISRTFVMTTPRDWTTLVTPDSTVNHYLRTTMATGLYTLNFSLPHRSSAREWLLDLGDVRESARVRLNGHLVGTAWSVPYRLRVGKYLKKGINHLEIEVTNLPANRIAEMDRRHQNWRIFKEINLVDLNYRKTRYDNWSPMPSGLNGPVTLIPCRISEP